MSATTATVFQDLWDHFEQRERQYLFLVLLRSSRRSASSASRRG